MGTVEIIDIRELIERFEEIEDAENEEEVSEREQIEELLDDLKGYGGDKLWRGDWYPLTLIADYHFETYAQELAEDIGAVDPNAGWPNSYIDWSAAAEALKVDYSSVSFDGVDYWYR